MENMTPEDRVERAWSRLTFGPGWEDRLSVLMAEEIKDAVAQALASATKVVEISGGDVRPLMGKEEEGDESDSYRGASNKAEA